MTHHFHFLRVLGFAAVLAFPAVNNCEAAKSPASPVKTRETDLIAVLKSDAPPAEKAITCKKLAVYGSEACVPALKPLLLNPELSSWARIALEAIPGKAADACLRDSLDSAHGRLLVGIINSIGFRKDTRAVEKLAALLSDADPEVVAAAADALGKIGGSKAGRMLNGALAKAPEANRTALAHGAILCAENSLMKGDFKDSVKLYDAVRGSRAAKQKILEATRGAILARRGEGIPLLLEQLRSEDPAFVGIGLRTARELAGTPVTKALAEEMNRASSERRPLILLALGDRNDPAGTPAIYQAAESGDHYLRLVAVGILDRMGDPASFPVLIKIAAEAEPDLAGPALAALARMAGTEVDSSLKQQLPTSSGNMRAALINLAAKRQVENVRGTVAACAADSDPAVRKSAVQYLAAMGTAPELSLLTGLLPVRPDATERAEIEAAQIAIASRTGSSATPALLPLTRNSDPHLRIIALHGLAAAGGPEALKAVTAAAADPDNSLQDEAVRVLSTWPNNWPDDPAIVEPLLSIAKSGKKVSHQVLAVRGCLQFLQNAHKIDAADRIARMDQLLPLITRAEEKRLAVSTAQAFPAPGAVRVLAALADEPAVAEEACAAIVKIAGSAQGGVPADQKVKALKVVLEKSNNASTKEQAEKLMQ